MNRERNVCLCSESAPSLKAARRCCLDTLLLPILLPIIDERLLAMINTHTHTHTETDENHLAETMKGRMWGIGASLYKTCKNANTFCYMKRSRQPHAQSEAYFHQVEVINLSVHTRRHTHTHTHRIASTLTTPPGSEWASLTTGIISLQQMVTVPLKNIFDYYFFSPSSFFLLASSQPFSSRALMMARQGALR